MSPKTAYGGAPSGVPAAPAERATEVGATTATLVVINGRHAPSYLEGEQCGYATGSALGYIEGWRACAEAMAIDFEAAVVTEVERRWTELHEVARAIGAEVSRREPYDVLADRRGQHERASQHRARLSERGVTP